MHARHHSQLRGLEGAIARRMMIGCVPEGCRPSHRQIGSSCPTGALSFTQSDDAPGAPGTGRSPRVSYSVARPTIL